MTMNFLPAELTVNCFCRFTVQVQVFFAINSYLVNYLVKCIKCFYQQCKIAFFDARVFNLFAKSYLTRNLDIVFKSNESSEKTAYNTRIIQVEHGLTPFTFLLLARDELLLIKTHR